MSRATHGFLGLWLLVAAGQAAEGVPHASGGADILAKAGFAGGLVVHVGCGDGRLTAELRSDTGSLTHGLDADPANVAKARQHIHSTGQHGRIVVSHFDGRSLPYCDNLVNLVVADELGAVPMAEVTRVLAPLGVAYVGGKKTVKPWPKEIDEWTHFLYDASGNAVGHDSVVGAPHHVQWEAGPKWARTHDHLASISALVSANGRLFYIIDEGSIASAALPPKWKLVARDAFNGIVLWKRAIAPWEGHLRAFRSGPSEIPRRLVAKGDRVYVTLGYGKPVTALDAATGETLRTYDDTDGTHEILCEDGVLYLAAGEIPAPQWRKARKRRGAVPTPREKRILAIEADTGLQLWSKSDEDTRELFPLSLAVGGDRVLFHSPSHLICLDKRSGKESWRTPRPVNMRRPGYSTPTLVVCDDVVLVAERNIPPEQTNTSETVRWDVTYRAAMKTGLGRLIAYSAATGKELWSCPSCEAYTSPTDLFVADGLVWVSNVPDRKTADFREGRDLRTGEVKRRLDTTEAFTANHHHRCYRNKATDRYVFLGRSGTSTIDLQGGEHLRHSWVRGGCQFGILPCNGLLYAPTHPCACYIQSKLSGFFALAPKRTADSARWEQDGEALEQGPAYGSLDGREVSASQDWPTYRGDNARSGVTKTAVPTNLSRSWTAKPGGRLTAPVVADGRAYVASVDRHVLHALNADSGDVLWTFAAGGRIDSPPSVANGMVVFGSRDGTVHCLRADDGRLIWRFRAGPARRLVVSYGQVESAWPVHGSVLLHEGTVYFGAGRSSYLDGGMAVYRLDLATGRQLSKTHLYDRDPVTGAQFKDRTKDDYDMPGGLLDILSCDGSSVYMGEMRFDLRGNTQEPTVPHLFSSAGFLDDTWWHRTYWQYGIHMLSGPYEWSMVGNTLPAGRIMSVDDSTIFGFGRDKYAAGGHVGLGSSALRASYDRNKGGRYTLFAVAKEPYVTAEPFQKARKTFSRKRPNEKTDYLWQLQIPLWVRAMVLADKALFIAGHPDERDKADPYAALDGAKGGMLWAVAAKDGSTMSKYALDAPPVFDGVAAAGGRLHLSLTDGSLTCMEGDRK